VDLHKVATLEEEHQRPFWSIGEGFEGSASDYTEYIVWLIGVVGVFYYMLNPNARRNLHDVEMDQPTTGHGMRRRGDAFDEVVDTSDGDDYTTGDEADESAARLKEE